MHINTTSEEAGFGAEWCVCEYLEEKKWNREVGCRHSKSGHQASQMEGTLGSVDYAGHVQEPPAPSPSVCAEQSTL